MIISIIAAMGKNRVIGCNGELPWKGELQADMRHFRRITIGHVVVMGRKTFLSIGTPLKGRVNEVLTRSRDFAPEGCFVRHSLYDVLSRAESDYQVREIFVIGGEDIFLQVLPFAHRIYLTCIDHEFEGDTFFPVLGPEWHEKSAQAHPIDLRNKYPCVFKVFERDGVGCL